MKLTVGDVVVYAAYGVGRIVAREKRVIVGADQEAARCRPALSPCRRSALRACCGTPMAYAACMRVVGIDPGLAACGYGVAEADGVRAEGLALQLWACSRRKR